MGARPSRLALLIGVPGCGDESLFKDLPVDVVRQDVTRMRDVLMESGYAVEVLGVAPEEPRGETVIATDASHGRCVKAIRAAAGRVPDDGTLLIYFSGHGLRVVGRDYLVPSDAGRLPLSDELDPESLIDLDQSRNIGHCQGKLVAMVVDACRLDPVHTIDVATLQGLPRLPNGVFRLALGCSAGEVCRYDSRGSVFTRELTRALSSHSSARSMTEVINATRQAMKLHHQTPRLEPVHVAEDWPVCDSVTVLDEWRTGAGAASLWDLTDTPTDPLVAAIKRHVTEYAEVVKRIGEAIIKDTGLADPWFDQTYPQRVLVRMADLLSTAAPLTPSETGLVVLAPFLREAVLALGLHDVRDLEVRDVSTTFRAGLRYDLEAVYTSFEHLTRRAGQLIGDPADAIVTWLVHSWLLKREDIWQQNQVRTWCRAAARAVLAACDLPTSTPDVDAYADVLLALARCVGGSVDAAEVTTTPPEVLVEVCRVKPVGRLLCLAGQLAVDTRRLPPVVAEHIGLRDPLPLRELRDVVTTLRWNRSDDRLHMTAACPHPALHVALEDVAALADELRARCVDDELFAGLPSAVTADRLYPANSPDTGVAYQQPLLKFRVAADRVQRLLMGSQIYDHQNDAVRELYQNALDACRYRHARYRFAYHGSVDVIPWKGRICFRQDDDGDGPYLDCIDNGVGMTPAILEKAFSEAGTRFVHDDGFRREQARWQRADPDLRLYPNSQFGIGVLSYFMLASDVTIWTVPTHEDGSPTRDRYEVVISGEGSLFRIRPAINPPVLILNGGTVVRLHLASKEPLDLAEILDDYVSYSDFELDARPHFHLPADDLRPRGERDEVIRANEYVWWTTGNGAVLADGIQTEPKQGMFSGGVGTAWRPHGDSVFGVVVNLTGQQRPTLNVSRSRVLDYDQGWLDEQLATSLPALTDWPQISIHWLWEVAAGSAKLARAIAVHLADRNICVWPGRESPSVRVGIVGCWPQDETRVLKLYRNEAYRPYISVYELDDAWFWLFPWRYRCWQKAGFDIDHETDRRAIPDDISGYPSPLSEVDDRPSVDPSFLLARIADGAEVDRELDNKRPLVIAGANLRQVRWVTRVDPEYAEFASEVYRTLAALPRLMSSLEPGDLRRRQLTGLLHLSHSRCIHIHRLWSEFCDVIPDLGEFPIAAPELSDDYVSEIADIAILNRQFDSEGAVDFGVSLQRILQASDALAIPVTEVTTRLGRLRSLGIWSPAGTGWGEEVDFRLADPLQRFVYELDRSPTILDVVGLAVRTGRSIPQAYTELRSIIESARLSVELPELSTRADEASAEVVHQLLGNFGKHEHIPDRLRALVHNVHHVAKSDVNAEELRAALHVVVPHWDVSCVVTWPVLLRVQAGGRLIDVHELMTRWFSPYLELSVPDPGNSRFRWDIRHVEALTTSDGAWKRPSALAILEYALQQKKSVMDLVREFEQYRQFGANVPEVVGALADIANDPYDHAMCEENVRAFEELVPLPDDLVTPLHLLRVAGRFGWPLLRAYDRLAALQPIGIRLAVDPGTLPPGIVAWQDLIVLTAELDGWPPTVAGTLTGEQLARAALAVGEEPAVTAARFARYADMFGLHVEECHFA